MHTISRRFSRQAPISSALIRVWAACPGVEAAAQTRFLTYITRCLASANHEVRFGGSQETADRGRLIEQSGQAFIAHQHDFTDKQTINSLSF